MHLRIEYILEVSRQMRFEVFFKGVSATLSTAMYKSYKQMHALIDARGESSITHNTTVQEQTQPNRF